MATFALLTFMVVKCPVGKCPTTSDFQGTPSGAPSGTIGEETEGEEENETKLKQLKGQYWTPFTFQGPFCTIKRLWSYNVAVKTYMCIYTVLDVYVLTVTV